MGLHLGLNLSIARGKVLHPSNLQFLLRETVSAESLGQRIPWSYKTCPDLLRGGFSLTLRTAFLFSWPLSLPCFA